jgi:hypothetical protein
MLCATPDSSAKPVFPSAVLRYSACLAPFALCFSPVGAQAKVGNGPSGRTAPAITDLVSAVEIAASFGIVTSVVRSVAHNRAVGGVRNSYHLRGQAIDVARRAGVSHQALEAALLRAGYRIIESIDERDHSHFAFAGRQVPALVSARTRGASELAPDASAPGSKSTTKRAPPALVADEHGSLQATGSPLIEDEVEPRSKLIRP